MSVCAIAAVMAMDTMEFQESITIAKIRKGRMDPIETTAGCAAAISFGKFKNLLVNGFGL